MFLQILLKVYNKIICLFLFYQLYLVSIYILYMEYNSNVVRIDL